MNKRKDSTMDKIRAEEDRIDAKLRDAGLYEEGLNLDEKRQLFQLIEVSCMTAQQEEEERKQQDHVFSETLNKSINFRHEPQADQSDVYKRELDCDSPTPKSHQTPSSSSASQSCTPTYSNQKKHRNTPSQKQEVQTPSQSQSVQKSRILSQESSGNSSVVQSQCDESSDTPASDHNEGDLFVSDPQKSKTPRRRLELAEVNTSESISQESQDQEEYDSQDTLVGSQEKIPNSVVGSKGVRARRPLREPLCSPDLFASNHGSNQSFESPQQSQNLFVSCSSDSSFQEVNNKVDTLVEDTPLASPKKKSIRMSVTNVQEGTVTSSPDKRAELLSRDRLLTDQINDSDGVDSLSATPEVSTSSQEKIQLPDIQLPDSQNSSSINDKLQQSNKEDAVMADTNSRGVNFSLGIKYDSDSTDIEEDITDNYTIKKLRSIDVFCPEVGSSIPMTRRVILKQENPEHAYMKHSKESLDECRKRILNLIDQEMSAIRNYQINHSLMKLRWSAPITVDRRVRDTLDKPKIGTRRQQKTDNEENDHNVWNNEQRQPRRALRLALKEQPETSTSCYDFIPDLPDLNPDWIDVGSKRRGRRGGRQLGLSRNPTKQSNDCVSSGTGNKYEDSSGTGSKLSKEDISDSEDFEIFPSAAKRREEMRKNKEEKEHISTTGSSTSSPSTIKTNRKSQDEDVSMEIVPDHLPKKEVIKLETAQEETVSQSRQTEERKVPESQPNVSSINPPGKRGPRKSFMLPPTSSNEEKSRDCVSSPKAKKKNVESSKKLPKEEIPEETDFDKLINSSKQNDSKINDEKKVDNTEDICILEEDRSSGPSLAKYPRREARRGRGSHPEPIRPPPVKVKKPASKPKVQLDESVEAVAGPSSSNQTAEAQAQNQNTPQAESMNVKNDEVEEEIPCPICQQYFSKWKIEVHASDCTGIEESQPEVRESRGRGNNQGRKRGCKRKTHNDTEVEEILDTPQASGSGANPWRPGPKKLNCVLCKELFNEGDDYLIHVQECQAMKDIQNNVMSPGPTKTPTPGKKQQGSTRGQGRNKQGYKTPEPSSSLFDYLEPGVLEYHPGDITWPQYRQPNTALVQIINSVAIKPHGLSHTLADLYPYCDSYSKRKAIGTYNRAVLSDRLQPGSIKVCKPTGAVEGPIVVNICGQFYMGKEYRKNMFAKKLAGQSNKQAKNQGKTGPLNEEIDSHLINGILSDTAANRKGWFRDGLKNLAEEVNNGMKVDQIVFPAYIGCGLAGGNWQNDYLPLIKEFAVKIRQQRIHVKVVQKNDSNGRKNTRPRKSDRQSTIDEYKMRHSNKQLHT